MVYPGDASPIAVSPRAPANCDSYQSIPRCQRSQKKISYLPGAMKTSGWERRYSKSEVVPARAAPITMKLGRVTPAPFDTHGQRRAASIPAALSPTRYPENVPDTAEERASATWDRGLSPEIAVAIATHDRAGFLPELVRMLESQTLAADRFEVVIADDASSDHTWNVLAQIAGRTPLRLRAIRLAANSGPAAARNVAATASRAPLVAFTDDDCLPSPSWLDALAAAFRSGLDLVQGRVAPDPVHYSPSDPWARTLWVTRGDWLFESCNIAYRRTSFDALGGFEVARPDVTRGTRAHFGEDTLLGWRLKAAGMRATFDADALVYHRVHAGTFGEWLIELRRRVLFPTVVRLSPGMGRSLFA